MLEDLYKVPNEWTRSLYLGLTLDWKYDKGHVNMSMSGYIAKMLHKFNLPKPTITQLSPYAHTKLNYGEKIQLTAPEDTSELLAPKDVKRLQQVICSLLFYGRSIYSSLLVELVTLTSAQTKATINTGQAFTKLLNYCASNIDTVIRFHA